MLIWVCALHCEAKPVIDFYRLKKSHDDNAFDVYRGDGMVCIISGTGKIASAAACAWIAAQNAREPALAWINLGVAGAAEDDIGKLFALDKIVDADSGQRYYPAPVVSSPLPARACLTLSEARQDYRDDCLFDMEASGFIYSALRFSSAELTRSLKVISDNRRHQTGRKRQQVSDLIQGNIEAIDIEATALLDLESEISALEFSAESWRQLLGMAHFTQTQKNRLRVLWRYLSNRDFSPEALLERLAQQKNAAGMIATLEQISYRDAEEL
ncbi:MAG: hypothetical protein JSU67_15155 [Gammaproteobacteria bacterium]|nr:MAG: hypothetical protein EP300_08510 [Gammaproteobacteria bacterium]UCH39479.1 MAG: hypothetical protein JSU67_15155 [Gammaproteobacteria bacterium]